eukprot:TRINITY_DN35358_c0_g1_i1.p1 TRINITY_DN35358_c0_g1~~TRINITY_DN35358_c0_g1_i1.p1  ORF type:complete len:914 (-),score=185.54 TRINITY_DN35358_c0_g1_i1:246-2987(-)
MPQVAFAPAMVVPGSPPTAGLAAPTTAGRAEPPGSPRENNNHSFDGDDNNKAPPMRASRVVDPKDLKQKRSLASMFGTHRWKVLLQNSKWYHSPLAEQIRSMVQGKVWAIVMVVALLLALFLPDISILAGVNSNTGTDGVLTIVMFMFASELFLLTIVDANYMLSFFQLMDLVGTISMLFDISYFLGTSADVAVEASNDGSAQQSLMLLRAARAAKVGARAGRLSRVLRFLRFLPFLAGGGRPSEDDTQTGIASMISGQLAHLLATRVACLTIILVMVIPLFDIWTFPQTDWSLQTWVNRLSANTARSAKVSETMTEIGMMEDFYKRYAYGPYEACVGVWRDPDFICDKTNAYNQKIAEWRPAREGPPRASSSLIVHTNTFMVMFNMHYTKQMEAGFAIATMIFVIFIMVFSGLTLSSVVTELAVRPLERMLETVRKIASTVFKFTAEVAEEGEADEAITAADIDSSNEMKLLEKVVQKLAIIADLQTTKNMPEKTDDMRDEDLGILSMMHGSNIVEEKAREARRSMAVPRKRQAVAQQVRLEDFGVSQEVFNSWQFNALALSKVQRTSLAVFTISKFHDAGDGYINNGDEVAMLQRFVLAVEKEYLPVPFHSFAHAIDVVHGVSRLMRLLQSGVFLSELEEFSLLIASIGHDIGHPGVNNGFLSEVGHELALQYNDRSPLENMHCAKLYTIVGKPETNVFFKLTREQYKEVRKNCIETILHTDMMAHQAMVKDLQMIYQMNTEVFTPIDGDSSPNNGEVNHAEIEIFSQGDTKVKVMNCLLHSADVSNPCRAWETTHAWALVCLEEFFAQGDQEKMLGIPVQFLNDRDKLNKPNSQIGFIEFMIAPFYAAQIRLWPSMRELGTNLVTNLQNWQGMWEEEVKPGDEEKTKVKGRVEKVRNNMQDAIQRTPPPT